MQISDCMASINGLQDHPGLSSEVYFCASSDCIVTSVKLVHDRYIGNPLTRDVESFRKDKFIRGLVVCFPTCLRNILA